ncbi:hypothetical protein CA13_23490 [Planctomycetes bacterium CA13]|uniref:Uncharacterized protein n=1 Tax=Novipirellula herctigrandis TaxID=2527986 RepID=A0A5C5Z2R4_9BACT|nr:hypothetical protein CA13_23490 [Planctomycetes bacterium CA13]
MKNSNAPSTGNDSKPLPDSPIRPAKRGSQFGMLLSIIVSSGVLIWAFTMPMRHGAMPNQSVATPVSSSQSRLVESQHRRLRAEQYREQALSMDRELISRQQRKDAWKRESLPDINRRTEKRAQERVERLLVLQQKIEELEGAIEDTPEWERLQNLYIERKNAD